MLKLFIISLALMSLILTGCGSKTPEPQVAEEKLDLEHVKKIEEQEREQEEKAAELLAQEAAIQIQVEEEEEEQQEEAQSSETGSSESSLSEKETENSIKDSKETKLTSTIKNIFKKGSALLSKKSEPKEEQIETLEIIEPESNSEEMKLSEGNKEEENQQLVKKADNPNATPKKENIQPRFLPTSKLALSSAMRLINCEKVSEIMKAIHERLLETKDLNIADRKLRDSKNDTLMPVIHFDFDQIVIKPDYRKLLRQQGPCVMKVLEARGDMILQIEGHADERGSDEYNMALGHRRANAVSNSIIPYLSDSKLTRIFSYGEEFPLIPGSNKKAWGQNRRVEFTLLLKKP